ncbi:MAG: BrxA/BrxB family bacilliredoxin [Cytophagales bacterium]|nr:BrxA/BrxB family bacilliredoxin [Cytophagales bacterium]
MYPEELVQPMKDELLSKGFSEFTTAEEVTNHFENNKGTTLVVVNSVCGCAAGACRPGVLFGLQHAEKKPDYLYTAFAGFDSEAVAKVREYLAPYPPSSPAIALFKDGDLVHYIERHHIEGRDAVIIGSHLKGVFEEKC